MFEFFAFNAERKARDRRAARMILRDHPGDTMAVVDRRIDKTSGRDRAHWKRVRHELTALLQQQGADPVRSDRVIE